MDRGILNFGINSNNHPEMMVNINNKLKEDNIDKIEQNNIKETVEVEELQKQEGQWNNEVNNHYKFIVKEVEIDVNDILEAIDKKMKENEIEWNRINFNYLSNAIEYLLRAPFKGQVYNDLKKAISEIQFIINK